MQNHGSFITFEGGEGVGKSTQIAMLAAHIRAQGRSVRLVREPGGTALGEDVRHILKHAPYGNHLQPSSELLLFAASRAQLVSEIIRPALDAGETVLCDRFTDSTLVYQGCGRGLSADIIAVVNTFATGGLRPALTVLLDLPVSAGLERAQRRASSADVAAPDRMETFDAPFYERVRTGYLALATAEPERFLVLDAAASPDAIAGQIQNEFHRRCL
ncbi:MAG: dTMP kinase [Puniceicoccales bacterium]|jgi:dTMP kinase|nr:dTMP kinase [Puniceicoccales bacterium]